MEGQPENWGWCVPGCDGELDRKTLEEDRSVGVKYQGIISIQFVTLLEDNMNVRDIYIAMTPVGESLS